MAAFQSTYGDEWETTSSFLLMNDSHEPGGLAGDLFRIDGVVSPIKGHEDLLSALYDEEACSPGSSIDLLSPELNVFGCDDLGPTTDATPQNTEPNKKKYNCSRCNFIARNKSHLWRHTKEHKLEPVVRASTKDWTCGQCGYLTDSKYNLQRHIQRNHAEQKTAQCGRCSKKFKDNDTLRMHMKYVHANQRDFPCDRCGKVFVDTSGLSRHRRLVHENARAFVCSACGKSFQTPANLRRHQQSCASARGNDANDVSVV